MNKRKVFGILLMIPGILVGFILLYVLGWLVFGTFADPLPQFLQIMVRYLLTLALATGAFIWGIRLFRSKPKQNA